MELTADLVRDMRFVAVAKPHDPLGSFAVSPLCRRDVEYGGGVYSVTFTFAVSGKSRAWHLEVYDRWSRLPVDVGKGIARVFFGDNYEVVELVEAMVEAMPPDQREEYRTGCHRQYVQWIDSVG